MGGKGKGKGGKGGKVKVKNDTFEKRKRTDSRDDDPPCSCRVFVRGFDFGTTDEQFEEHMKQVGTIAKVKWVTKGSAECTYSSAQEAAAAVEQLNQTIIAGNT